MKNKEIMKAIKNVEETLENNIAKHFGLDEVEENPRVKVIKASSEDEVKKIFEDFIKEIIK